MIPRIIRRNIAIANSYCITQNNKVSKKSVHGSTIANDDGENGQNNEQKLRNLLDRSASFIDTKPQNDEDKWATLPYAQGTILTKRERTDLDIQRPKIDPRDTSIILFPGQGAQFVGMAKSLENVPAAKDVFDYASEILK